MADATVFERIRKKTAPFFKHSHHDLYHIERVYNLALRLAREEGADLDTVKAAVLLHDIARAKEDEGKISDHAEEGARMAKRILEDVDFPKNKIDQVVDCIEVHRFRKGATPKSLEAKILQDADRLDILGAVGIARVFTRGGWSNKPIHDPTVPPKEKYDGKSDTSLNHIYEKLLKVKDTMNTAAARKLAEERHKYVEQFVERLLKEWKAEI
jgi:uncharacterized protein